MGEFTHFLQLPKKLIWIFRIYSCSINKFIRRFIGLNSLNVSVFINKESKTKRPAKDILCQY
jgi:hypothetical protein